MWKPGPAYPATVAVWPPGRRFVSVSLKDVACRCVRAELGLSVPGSAELQLGV